MRRAGLLVLAAALAAAAAGCATGVPEPPPEPPAPELTRVQLVQEGMTPAQVRELLGEPHLVEQPGGARIWHYPGGVVLFRGERVALRHAKPRSEL